MPVMPVPVMPGVFYWGICGRSCHVPARALALNKMDNLGQVEALFCLLFTFEMLVRINQQSWGYFQDLLNLLDYSLVVASWLDVATSGSTYRERVQLGSTIRVFRFVRIVRLTEGNHKGLFLICKGLADAVESVVQLTVISAILIFALAVFLTSLVSDPYALDRWPAARMYCGSMYRSAITVMQLATLDQWTDVAVKLIEISPLTLITIVGTLFGLNFGVINLLVGIMVDKVANLSSDAQEMHEKLQDQVHEMLLSAIHDDIRTRAKVVRAEHVSRSSKCV